MNMLSDCKFKLIETDDKFSFNMEVDRLSFYHTIRDIKFDKDVDKHGRITKYRAYVFYEL